MNKITYISILILTSTLCYSQSYHIDIHNIALDSLINYEKSIESEFVENSSNYLNSKGIAQPIIYQRKFEIIPNLNVQYTFYEKDSAMHKILYEWDISTFEKVDNNPKDTVFLNAMLSQFNRINKLIDSTFNSEQKELAELNLDEINSSKGYKLTNEWQPNDSLKIKNHITLKNSFEKKKFSTSPTVHRIRTYVNKVTPSPIRKLDESTITKFESIALKFVETVTNDKSKSHDYLSEQIVEQITTEQMNQLELVFQDAKPFKTISSGTELGLNYQYGFILVSGESKSMNRKVNIKFIFDEEDKIIGIK